MMMTFSVMWAFLSVCDGRVRINALEGDAQCFRAQCAMRNAQCDPEELCGPFRARGRRPQRPRLELDPVRERLVELVPGEHIRLVELPHQEDLPAVPLG